MWRDLRNVNKHVGVRHRSVQLQSFFKSRCCRSSSLCPVVVSASPTFLPIMPDVVKLAKKDNSITNAHLGSHPCYTPHCIFQSSTPHWCEQNRAFTHVHTSTDLQHVTLSALTLQSSPLARVFSKAHRTRDSSKMNILTSHKSNGSQWKTALCHSITSTFHNNNGKRKLRMNTTTCAQSFLLISGKCVALMASKRSLVYIALSRLHTKQFINQWTFVGGEMSRNCAVPSIIHSCRTGIKRPIKAN